MACDQGSSNNLLIAGRDPATSERYVIYEYPEGGWGANAERDGLSAIFSIVGNTWNVPVEVVEQRFPVRVDRYELRQDSGGPGEHRGGLSIRRDHTVLDHDAEVSVFANRVRVPPWGLDGGHHGAAAEYVINPERDNERPAAAQFGSKASGVLLRSGECISQRTAGGGGWGNPKQRSADLVVSDVELGYVSRTAAAEIYGVAIGENGELDEVETKRFREGTEEARDGND